VRVVDRFEVVEIEQQHRDRLAALLRLREQPAGLGLQRAPVQEPGERIARRLDLQALAVLPPARP
jgi:hypothetical protein